MRTGVGLFSKDLSSMDIEFWHICVDVLWLHLHIIEEFGHFVIEIFLVFDRLWILSICYIFVIAIDGRLSLHVHEEIKSLLCCFIVCNWFYYTYSIFCVFIHHQPIFLMQFLLVVHECSMRIQEIMIRFLNTFVLFLYDGVRHIFIAAFPPHWLQIVWVDHLFLWCHHNLFFFIRYIPFLLIHFLQKSGIMHIMVQ